MRLLIAILCVCSAALGQASTAPTVPIGTGDYSSLIALAQALGPYGTIVVLAVLVSRIKLPAVPLRVEGPLQLSVSGPVELSGKLDCRDPSARTRAEDPK